MSRNRFVLILSALVAAAVAAGAWGLRIQPAGSARIIESEGRLSLLPSRVGWHRDRAAGSCLVRAENGRVSFGESIVIPDAHGDVTAKVSFTYRLPARAFESSEGTWCSDLSRSVQRLLLDAVSSRPVASLLADRREQGRLLASRLARDLERFVALPAEVTVRLTFDEGFQETLPQSPVKNATENAPPLFFIGLDGADWEHLDRLIEAGRMPNLAKLRAEGAHGSLATMHPPLSPLLWTSMMTGTSPLAHRILDFTRFHPVTGTREPITSDERQRAAIWNLATYAGKRVSVLGLWATYPAEPVYGTIVSDRFFTFLHRDEKPQPQTTWPRSIDARMRDVLAGSEASVTLDRMQRFLPSTTAEELSAAAADADPYGSPISALRRILIETDVYDRIARSEWVKAKPELLILYVQGTDSVGHMFAPFAPPRQPEIEPGEFERYSMVADRYFEEIDRLLGEWAALARLREGRIMIASDHGFHWSEGRPTRLSSFAAASAAKWHRAEGIYLLWGKGIEPGRVRGKGSILQTAPTIASLIGLPRSRDFEAESLVPSSVRDDIDYSGYYEPSKPVEAGSVANEEIEKLRALGYIGAGETTSRPASSSSTRTAGSHNNEGLIHRAAGDDAAAIKSFEEAIRIDPNLASALWNLSDVLFARKEVGKSDEYLVRAVAAGLPEGPRILIGRAIGYGRSGENARSLALLDSAVKTMPENAELRLFRGRYLIDARNCRAALDDFAAVQKLQPANPAAFASAGIAYLCLEDPRAAREQFARSLAINPNQPKLRAMLR